MKIFKTFLEENVKSSPRPRPRPQRSSEDSLIDKQYAAALKRHGDRDRKADNTSTPSNTPSSPIDKLKGLTNLKVGPLNVSPTLNGLKVSAEW